MGVFSKKSQENQSGENTPLPSQEQEGNKIKDKSTEIPVKDVFMLPCAMMGKSGTVIIHDDKPFPVSMVDKCFKIGKKYKGQKRIDLMHSLVKAGFKHVSSETEYEEIDDPKDIKTIEWVFGHPDNESDNKKEGNFAIKVGEEEVQLELVNGEVTVEKEEIAKVLLEQGFNLINEVKEEK